MTPLDLLRALYELVGFALLMAAVLYGMPLALVAAGVAA
jgi:hypothetical protein